jgi:hypothetical protein
MVLTSGDGLIYNVARAKMLAAAFRWTDTDKYAAIVDADYAFDELHATLADVTPGNIGLGKAGAPFISANSWAGSSPPQFSGEVWTKPIGSLILTRYVGTLVQTGDYTKYELIACLTTFLGGPIYPDGSPFSITYDQSNAQQGWFRP